MSDTGIMGNSTVGAGTTMHGSVSVWLARFCGPNREQAAAALWNAYAPRLTALARRVLGTSRQRAFDAEDIVQEAFGAFFNAVEAGWYPAVANRATGSSRTFAGAFAPKYSAAIGTRACTR